MEKIKAEAKRILGIIRVYDSNGMMSLTNITMWLIIYKVAMTPAVSFTDITALAVAVMGYKAKRIIEK